MGIPRVAAFQVALGDLLLGYGHDLCHACLYHHDREILEGKLKGCKCVRRTAKKETMIVYTYTATG